MRLKSRGASLGTPFGTKEELHGELVGLCDRTFTPSQVEEIYTDIGMINGRWLSEERRVHKSSTFRRLRELEVILNALCQQLKLADEGFRTATEIEVGTWLREVLATDSNIGTIERAHDFISKFAKQCETLRHASGVAAGNVNKQKGKRAGKPFEWYDDFVRILLQLAKESKNEPNLNKDRITRERGGWLFLAAQRLEKFLWPDMRSSNGEQCGKRLERSRSRLKMPVPIQK